MTRSPSRFPKIVLESAPAGVTAAQHDALAALARQQEWSVDEALAAVLGLGVATLRAERATLQGRSISSLALRARGDVAGLTNALEQMEEQVRNLTFRRAGYRSAEPLCAATLRRLRQEYAARLGAARQAPPNDGLADQRPLLRIVPPPAPASDERAPAQPSRLRRAIHHAFHRPAVKEEQG